MDNKTKVREKVRVFTREFLSENISYVLSGTSFKIKDDEKGIKIYEPHKE